MTALAFCLVVVLPTLALGWLLRGVWETEAEHLRQQGREAFLTPGPPPSNVRPFRPRLQVFDQDAS